MLLFLIFSTSWDIVDQYAPENIRFWLKARQETERTILVSVQ